MIDTVLVIGVVVVMAAIAGVLVYWMGRIENRMLDLEKGQDELYGLAEKAMAMARFEQQLRQRADARVLELMAEKAESQVFHERSGKESHE